MVDANPLLMEVVTITRPANKATLQARLDALLREREVRQKRGCGYGVNVSDGWLERDIATLHEAINLTPAAGVDVPAPARWCPECRSAGVVGIEQDVCPTCDGTGKVAAIGVAPTAPPGGYPQRWQFPGLPVYPQPPEPTTGVNAPGEGQQP